MPNERASDLSLLFESFVVSQRVSAVLKEAMASSPISPLEYAIYSLVHDQVATTPTAMAERLGMPVTTVLDHLRLMDERGHITRERNPADGRSYLVSLTSDGYSVHRQAGDDFDRAMDRILQHLKVDEEDVRAALDALSEATDAALADLRALFIRLPS